MSDPAEDLARWFHETYEALAPSFGGEASPMPWNEVPKNNRDLMVAVCRVIIGKVPRNADAQTIETRERMWQHKTGVLLALIEDAGDPELFKRACAAMDVHWRTGNPTDEEWAAAAMGSYRAVLQAARAAGLLHKGDEEDR